MTETAFVLIVEDERAHGEAIAEALSRSNFACNVVESGTAAIESIQHRPPDVVVTDYKLGGKVDGVAVLREAKDRNPDSEVILITAFGSESLARDVLSRDSKYQAYDYLIKPIDIDLLRDKVKRAAKQALTGRESRMLREQVRGAFEFSGIIGNSEAILREVKRIKKLARSKATVLLVGETGTGKELFAQAIHENSPRAGKPFKVLNCAAVSETLLESELFGHVKGAFTGAAGDRKGLLAAADGGTMFLDEIGDMPLPMQAKLLRALETGEVIPVGSNETVYCDVRFVAATNRDLSELVSQGMFREDLFYRLHGQAPIRIPPLRQRREDIPVLAQRFIDQANKENHTHITGIAPDAMRKLVNNQWPGNVRELRNVVFRMCLESEGPVLQISDLPESLQASTDLVRLGPPNLAGMSMADVEKLHIMNTLRMFGGNREKTAKALGIGARTLYRKLRDYGLR
ncbi:MAG: sigma-54-dependent Fis family transcriptional regulator [Planctomycetes bacterium]|nr:sigma-54-dependent Fis family transcriptional regulator [Planctomycetota bacterium]MBI3835125.1 sigma-54-dependent Fis family transcriptional regulator [Planctomycetota bacterium]